MESLEKYDYIISSKGEIKQQHLVKALLMLGAMTHPRLALSAISG